MYTARFDRCHTSRWRDMVYWCQDNISPQFDSWNHWYPTMFFRNEQDYVFFMLRWAQ